MTLHVVLGLLLVLAAVSWFHYRRTGGRPETDEDVFGDAPEWGDERELGLLDAHHRGHDVAGGEDAD